MNRLFRTNREYFLSTVTQFNPPRIFCPISYRISPNGTPFSGSDELEDRPQSSTGDGVESDSINHTKSTAYCHSHPWPEWVDLMKILSKKGYLGEGDVEDFQNRGMRVKEANLVRTACLNFTRDRFDLISYFSRKDIEIVAGSGCPSTDRKVVNSGKRLRAHVDIDEENACSSCILRGNCERAYAMAREGEAAHTVDLMRILLTYGLDPITGTVENELCRRTTIEESVRRLLKEMVEFSFKELDSLLPNVTSSKRAASVQESSSSAEKGRTNVPIKEGDWLCPKCNFLNFARNIKCLRCNEISPERLRKQWEDQDHLPLKKGDWICDKCNFLNFARNTRCFLCKEKPPKRELSQGDWECDSCNFINFQRNMVCLKCDHKRPKASNSSEASAKSGQGIQGFSHFHSKGLSFVRDEEDETSGELSIRQNVQPRDNGAGRWRFLADEREDTDGTSSRGGVSGFVDFPIAGGKSKLSQNSDVKLKWKTEMLRRSRYVPEGGKSSPACLRRRPPEFVECSSSDEEMDEWFGHGKRMQKEEE